ncbi:hypothetical protein J6590_026621 [Homalodisca vitripennis]|nr:hypothetical protein J6590_026621 [Homalodisca vitripennis]
MEPKTRRPTKPMTKRRAKVIRRRKVYDAIAGIDEHFMEVLKEANLDLTKKDLTQAFLKQRAEREAEEARLDALAALSTTETVLNIMENNTLSTS